MVEGFADGRRPQLGRRNFLFTAAPAIIALPHLMKLSTGLKLLPRVEPILANLPRNVIDTALYHPRPILSAEAFRQIVEPALREHFEEAYRREIDEQGTYEAHIRAHACFALGRAIDDSAACAGWRRRAQSAGWRSLPWPPWRAA